MSLSCQWPTGGRRRRRTRPPRPAGRERRRMTGDARPRSRARSMPFRSTVPTRMTSLRQDTRRLQGVQHGRRCGPQAPPPPAPRLGAFQARQGLQRRSSQKPASAAHRRDASQSVSPSAISASRRPAIFPASADHPRRSPPPQPRERGGGPWGARLKGLRPGEVGLGWGRERVRGAVQALRQRGGRQHLGRRQPPSVGLGGALQQAPQAAPGLGAGHHHQGAAQVPGAPARVPLLHNSTAAASTGRCRPTKRRSITGVSSPKRRAFPHGKLRDRAEGS